MSKVKLGKLSWRVTNMRALLIWFVLGGFGLHRLYVGRWLGALLLAAYTLGTLLMEIYFIEPASYLSGNMKDNLSIGITVILFAILIRDLFMMRYWIDDVNKPSIDEVFK